MKYLKTFGGAMTAVLITGCTDLVKTPVGGYSYLIAKKN